MNNFTNFRIDTYRHEKMKDIANKSSVNVTDIYREAIDYYITHKTQDLINTDSQLESYINKRIAKTEDRLASLIARVGMDSSISIMGLTLLLSKLMKVERKEIYDMLRKEGAAYFSRPYKAQNDKD